MPVYFFVCILLHYGFLNILADILPICINRQGYNTIAISAAGYSGGSIFQTFYMEKHTVTVYIEGRSYQIAISVNNAVHETTYEVITSGNILKDFLPDTEEFIPEFINWQEDSMVMPDERIKLVESEQIARLIWTDILDMMEH